MNNKKILLTGGSGGLGKQLTSLLLSKGYSVSILSRGEGKDKRVQTYKWDVNKGIIDDACIDGVDTIIHLAGAGIADERWTDERKKIIIESRTKSIALVYDLLKRKSNKVRFVISASGIGYYSDRGDELLTEENPPANDFLGQCCVLWEQAVDEGEKLGLRIAKFRTGVVLDKHAGALPKLSAPVKFGFGAALGSGRQWVPWIHWQDVAGMYLYAIEQELGGAYNMVAPNPVTNKQLTQHVARHLKRPLWLPNVPAFGLKLALGEMSTLVLGSTKVAADKIEQAGYIFKFDSIDKALTDIYGR
ncbi:TIGR01777 family oxidoreductase [Mucilaginibacter sp. UR6-1]|uniref:TIGR01777 family oxidoreductase n=1 Tax=Mucilaginibacter sp. UR6-1 TaxID=1435643 RepID=UPI001E351D40|nr:TIGR01777 family oxidoreductase [Mucilaginibacter sp. UR6-1]MCC8410804.1 TIGR01777 family oxidoreductase [Mucilaginibacter sp. UR6-1]